MLPSSSRSGARSGLASDEPSGRFSSAPLSLRPPMLWLSRLLSSLRHPTTRRLPWLWRIPWLPRPVGFAAGLFAVSMIIGSAAGALWGPTRPELTGRAVGDGSGGYIIDALADIQFTSFGWFVILTAIGGAACGLVAYLQGSSARGIAMLLWVGLVTLAASWAFWVFGQATATSLPETPGDVVQWVPSFNPGIGFAVAPFLAMFSYWSAAFVSADAEWELTPPHEESAKEIPPL